MPGNGPIRMAHRFEKLARKLEYGSGQEPWLVRVPHAEVRLACDWPRLCQARIARGAIVEQVEEQVGASVEWHNHGDDKKSSARPALTFFRIRPAGIAVWFWGRTAHTRAAWLAANVHALRMPAGNVIPIEEASVDLGSTDVQVTGKSWYTYELLTPIFPSFVVWMRRPREPGPAREAWAAQYVASSITDWMEGARSEIERQPRAPWGGQLRPVPVLHDIREERVEWSRPERDDGFRAMGFRCRFTVNAVLPDGVGLGRHRAEGFGMVRLVHEWGRS